MISMSIMGCRAFRPRFGKEWTARREGDTLAISTLDRLGRSRQNLLVFAEALRDRGAGLWVLNLGGADVDTHTPMGSMVFTVMAALAQMELKIKREGITDFVAKCRAAGKDLVESGQPTAQVARDLGRPRATLYRRIRELSAAPS